MLIFRQLSIYFLHTMWFEYLNNFLLYFTSLTSSLLQIFIVKFCLQADNAFDKWDFVARLYEKKLKSILNLYTTLLANSADDKMIIFFLSSQKTGFDISCKLSPLKCQILFTGINKKNISVCHLLKISTQSAKC